MLNLFKKKEKKIVLYKPIAGRVMDISETPDEAFSQKLLGDGLTLIPDGEEIIKAPCDGNILHIAQTYHAIALETEEGVEVLIHIGLDTVLLQGKGFSSYVKNGDRVRKGDKLIAFDRAYIEGQGKSLITPIVITNMDEKVKEIQKQQDPSSDILMEIFLK
ncbi:MAG: PTS glucose transporter subunit IIA [Thermotaleaceae bacterium]